MDKRRKTTVQLPQPMPNVACVPVFKILGITFTNHLSVAEHVQTVINSNAQTLYASRTLRAHGMDDAALQTVFRSVVIAKLTYASSAWWGLATTTDRQRLQTFIRRSHRSRFVSPSLPPLDELCRASDDKLFASITKNREHVLHELLPPQSVASQNYNLRPRKHHFELPNKTSHLTDCNFMQRMLFLET